MQPRVFRAAENGDTASMEALHRQNAQHLHGVSFRKNTALHIAARSGHFDLVRWILGNITDSFHMCGACNSTQNTPLHEAAKGGNGDIVTILLQHNKATLYSLNTFGESALLIACRYGHVETMKLLLAATPSYMFWWSAKPLCRILFDFVSLFGMHVWRSHQACLHVAAHGGHIEVVKLLLEKSRHDTMLQHVWPMPDVNGATPLHTAVYGGHINCIHEIIAYIINDPFNLLKRNLMASRDKLGWCPIHIAAIKGRTDMIDEFLSWMPDSVELDSADGKTALHFAVDNDQIDVLQKLLAHEREEKVAELVSYNSDKNGNTALHLAAINGVDPQVVKFMLAPHGMNVNAVNKQGLTPIDIAVAASHMNSNSLEIVTILREAGASPLFKWQAFETTSSLSQDNQNRNVIEVDTLVASLVATVTFAAIFQVPGGIEDDKNDIEYGAARFSLDSWFLVFLVTDSIALFTSLIVVVGWLFRKRLKEGFIRDGSEFSKTRSITDVSKSSQKGIIADESRFANLSGLSLGISILFTSIAFFSATILVTIPRNLEAIHVKDGNLYKKYLSIYTVEMVVAHLPMFFITIVDIVSLVQVRYRSPQPRLVHRKDLVAFLVLGIINIIYMCYLYYDFTE